MKVRYIEEMIQYNQRIGCRIVEQGLLEGDVAWRYYGVSSPFHRLYQVTKGKAYIRYEGVEHVLSEGHVYLIRRNTTMDYYTKKPFEKNYLHLNYPIIGGADLLEHCAPIIDLPLSVKQYKQLDRLFVKPCLEAYSEGMSILYEVMQMVLVGMSKDQLPNILNDRTYHPLVAEMMQRLDANFSVEEMADFCQQSSSDFSRKFKEALGLSPKAYLHKQLVEEGKLRLLSTQHSVKTIASDLGYEDSLYFSRFFKKRTGMSPTKYRASQMQL